MRPSAGVISADAALNITVHIQSGYSASQLVRDKFLVMACVIDSDTLTNQQLIEVWKVSFFYYFFYYGNLSWIDQVKTPFCRARNSMKHLFRLFSRKWYLTCVKVSWSLLEHGNCCLVSARLSLNRHPLFPGYYYCCFLEEVKTPFCGAKNSKKQMFLLSHVNDI